MGPSRQAYTRLRRTKRLFESLYSETFPHSSHSETRAGANGAIVDGATDRDQTEPVEHRLIEFSELNAAVGEVDIERHVAMTCQVGYPPARGRFTGLRSWGTSSPSSSRSRTQFASHSLNEQLPDHQLPRDRYFVFDRALENRRSLFREAESRETQVGQVNTIKRPLVQ